MAYPLVPYNHRVDLVQLYLYEVERKKALKANSTLSNRVEYVNNVLEMYESRFPQKRNLIGELKVSIRTATKGIPDLEGQNANDRDMFDLHGNNHSMSTAVRYQAKRYYRTLAKVHHPDLGGDSQQFDEIHKAYKRGDIDFLQHQYVLLHLAKDLFWRVNEGIAFWQTRAERAAVNMKAMQGLPTYKVVAYHTCRNFDKAETAMRDFLDMRILQLQSELAYIVNTNSRRIKI